MGRHCRDAGSGSAVILRLASQRRHSPRKRDLDKIQRTLSALARDRVGLKFTERAAALFASNVSRTEKVRLTAPGSVVAEDHSDRNRLGRSYQTVHGQ